MVNSIKIGNKIYLVEYKDNLRDLSLNGQLIFQRSVVEVQSNLEPQLEQEILAHEAVYGMLEFIGEGKKGENEESVQRITNGLLMLIKDNPELFFKTNDTHSSLQITKAEPLQDRRQQTKREI